MDSYKEYLEQLRKNAEVPSVLYVNQSVRFERYVETGKSLIRQSSMYRKKGLWEAEFVMLWRFAKLYTKVLEHHNGRTVKQNERGKREMKREAEKAIDRLEEIQEHELKEAFYMELEAAKLPSEITTSLSIEESKKENEEEKECIEQRETETGKENSELEEEVQRKEPETVYPFPSAPVEQDYPPPPDFSNDLLDSTKERNILFDPNIIGEFLEYAQEHTWKNVEFCGILCGAIREGRDLEVSHVLLPKQVGASDSVEMLNEIDVFAYQEANELLTLGWIHTHPSHDAFLSSVDSHTHFSYQIMLPEAIAVVVAPSSDPFWNVFHLKDPEGMELIGSCSGKGFHQHPFVPFEVAKHVIIAETKWSIVDLRSSQ